MHNLNKQPPVWAPDAVPSNQGWKHPVTGELLVSIVLDPSLYQTQEPVISTKTEIPVIEPVVIEPTLPKVEVVKASSVKKAEEPKAKPGPKPKAAK